MVRPNDVDASWEEEGARRGGGPLAWAAPTLIWLSRKQKQNGVFWNRSGPPNDSKMAYLLPLWIYDVYPSSQVDSSFDMTWLLLVLIANLTREKEGRKTTDTRLICGPPALTPILSKRHQGHKKSNVERKVDLRSWKRQAREGGTSRETILRWCGWLERSRSVIARSSRIRVKCKTSLEIEMRE